MIKFLSLAQVRIATTAERIFHEFCTTTKSRSMFRVSGHDISVGLALSVGTEHFIVHQTIPWNASDSDLNEMLCELVFALANSHISVLGRPVSLL